ncbi:hypothetical protein [Enterococcus diestrammenae]|uniref:hypothetical protein n=1 Tax=Enterococcus sp. DIV1390a TaxID=2774970 RepID=UPI00192A6752|nr:hypothetical protein [Enterococcus diestrammenae]KAF1298296.1 hypothetical protein BAU18_13505 [Enterococcus diestrammenae]
MKKIIKNTKFKLESAVIALGTLFITDPVFAATDPQAKLVQAGNTIKGVLLRMTYVQRTLKIMLLFMEQLRLWRQLSICSHNR